jgi:glyoxylase-like metal-dependent hydrolase (beta-lactamase superfamily II)
MKAKLNETGGPVKYVIYTHGHRDHVGGSSVFTDDQPEYIAQSLLPERLEKYEILKAHHHRIASIQFNLPFDSNRELPPVVQPTITFDESMEFKLGDKTFELYHARAETDDATWVFVPELKTVFVGDLIIAGYPNIGNTWVYFMEQDREFLKSKGVV